MSQKKVYIYKCSVCIQAMLWCREHLWVRLKEYRHTNGGTLHTLLCNASLTPIMHIVEVYLAMLSCIVRAVLSTASIFTLSPNSFSRCSSRIPWGMKTQIYHIQIHFLENMYSVMYWLPDLQAQWQRLHLGQVLHLVGFPWSPSCRPAKGSSTRQYAETWRETSISL